VGGADSQPSITVAVERGNADSDSWHLSDLSLHGAFLHGGPLRQQGAQLQLALCVRDADVSLDIPTQARVTWLNDATHPTQPGRPAGMGVTFCDMEEDDLRLLSAYLNRRAADSLPGSVGMPSPARDTRSMSHGGGATSSPALPASLIGTQIGAYRILELVGSGGMADVFLAVHTQIGRHVALKKLNPTYTQDSGIVRRFFDEARVVNQIHHPNIIEITDFITHDDGYFYVMELLEGPTLEDILRGKGLLPVERVVRIALQLCEAIAAVHQAGVVHRDLKPANVMLIEHGDETDFVKLLDFGVAKLREPLSGQSLGLTVEGSALGTPGYMAPEQLLHNRVDERSDIYALGVILYRMITGRVPYVAENPLQLLVKQANEPPKRIKSQEAARVPRDLVDMTMRSLNRDPERRPQAVAQMVATLGSLQTFRDASGPHEQVPAEWVVRRPEKRWRWLVAGLGVAALIAVSGAWWFLRDDPPAADVVRTAEAPHGVTAGAAATGTNAVAGGAAVQAAGNAATGARSPQVDAAAAAPGSDRSPEQRPDANGHRTRKNRSRRTSKSVLARPRGGRASGRGEEGSFFDQFSD
jgi:serine/threonine-protein kinase